MRRPRYFLCAALVALGLLARLAGAGPADFKLKGSQPLTGGDSTPIKVEHLFVPPQGTVPYGQPCIQCHDAGTAQPYGPWQGSMMAQAARDPLFYAQLDLANADGSVRPSVDGMSDMCLRCHSPVGWLEGRSANPTGMGFIEKDLFGVQCHFCHRLVNPAQAPGDLDWTLMLSTFEAQSLRPTTFGNGMYVVDSKNTRRGPYDAAQLTFVDHQTQFIDSLAKWNAVPTTTTAHPTFDSNFHRSSNLCGTCHDVSNPKDCQGADETNVQDCFPIERTWSEWGGSKFATEGEAGNCQSCHMSGPHNGIGFGAACEQGSASAHLNDVHFHDLTGGNVWMPQAILHMKARYETCVAQGGACPAAEQNFVTAVNALYPPAGVSPFTGVNTAALDEGAERARRTLKRSATLEVESVTPSLKVKLTNKTGHKLPTGYPEGRRLWLNVKFFAPAGALLAESGEYTAATGTLFHDQNLIPGTAAVPYDVAVYTDGSGTGTAASLPGRPTKVWEGRMHWDKSDCSAADPADCPEEFHFTLNNQVDMDNRIPPEGWSPATYTAKRASPVIPAAYSSNGWQGNYIESGTPVHWDRIDYPLPTGTDRVRMTLNYQTASREYIEALRDDNPNSLTGGGFNRGTLLEDVWQKTGRSAPVPLLTRVHAIVDTDGNQLSDGWELGHGLGSAGCLDDSYNGDPDADGLANWQEFQLDNPPALVADPCDPQKPFNEPARRPVDLILVLDVSGSMNDPAPVSGKPKIQVLREAVELFLETWKDHAVPGDQIGVVYFGDEAHPYGGTLLHNFVTEWKNIRDDVKAKAPGGWTAMGAGLHTAMASLKNPVTQELIFDPMNPRNRHVILFSNGMQNRSPMLVPDLDFPEFLVVRDQTAAANPEVTGNSNVVIGAGLYSGFPIAPHTLHVHTVGIGVVAQSGGDGWHTLLEKLAQQQVGKHNFITDAKQLEGVFLEDLVQALKGNTVEYVLREEIRLADAKPVELRIPVNPTASKVSIVISWRGQKSPPPWLELVRPDGVAEAIAPIARGGGDWAILTRFFDPRTGDPGEVGTWTLRLAHPRKGRPNPNGTGDDPQGEILRGEPAPLDLRVHVLLDDRQLKYDFIVPRELRIGQDLLVKSLATEGDQPLRWMDEVTVTVERPGASIGELLARSRRRLGENPPFDADAVAVPFQRHLLAAFGDPSFAASLTPTAEDLDLVDDGTQGDTTAGDGRFARLLPTPQVPGHYRLRFRMKGHTLSGHPFVREEVRSLVVKIGPLSAERSELVRGKSGGQFELRFTPRDAAGNLLGPGYGAQLVVRTDDGLELGVVDQLDGSYTALYPDGADPDLPVRVSLGGDVFHEGPVPGQSLLAGGCWWILLLVFLVLLLLLLLWLWRRSRP